jgi:Cu/Ag efflux protein CusF
MTRAEKLTTTATVVKVDVKKRDLTLRGDDGTEFTVETPKSVKLEELKEGDRLKIQYYEAIAISLKKGEKGEAGTSSSTGQTTITETNAGTAPGGMVVHRIKGTFEVVKVDHDRNKLTVRRPNGAIDTINVREPAMQAQLAHVREGDRIHLSYTEAVAITVMKEMKEGGGSSPGY